MLPILVLYGTTDGQTGKIARFVANQLRSLGSDVDLVEAQAPDRPDPTAYDAVVVLASVHISAYQRPVQRWVTAHAAALAKRPTAFLSVCLAVLQSDEKARHELSRILERFTSRTHWTPTVSRHIPGALLYTRYGWIKRWVMRRIAEKAGGDTDTSRDFEYTDWDDLRGFVRQFHRMVAEAGGRATGVVEREVHPVG